MRWPAIIYLVALSLGATTALAEGKPADPQDLVRITADQVLAEVTAKQEELEKDQSGIYAIVEQYVLPYFDFERMTKSAMGRHWRRANESQQQQLVGEFRELLVRTYAVALLNYSGQTIEYLPLRFADGQKDVTVATRISTVGAPPIPINYRLARADDGWKVYDVSIDGVSLVINYRSTFSSSVQRSGIDGLIKQLSDRNAKLRG